MKNIMKTAKEYWFVAFFMLVTIYPLYGGLLDKGVVLSGVVQESESVERTKESIMDGSYQAWLNNYWDLYFPGKSVLIRIRNQMVYSLLHESPNRNVVIGKNEYLYEPRYIAFETQMYPPESADYFEELANDLQKLSYELEKNGKELYIFISPSKADFCKDSIPVQYDLVSPENRIKSNYEMLIEVLTAKQLHCYDSIDYIKNNVGKYESPVFYKLGTHWSHVWGESVAAEFLEYIKKHSKWDLSTIKISENKSDEPIYPDADLYDSLNLLLNSHDNWYASESHVLKEGKDKPNVFYRGCSFMGQSLNMLINKNVFGENVHFENSYYFTDNYSNSVNLTNSESYDEMDMDRLMGQTDIFSVVSESP